LAAGKVTGTNREVEAGSPLPSPPAQALTVRRAYSIRKAVVRIAIVVRLRAMALPTR